jgi:hypothetical protein
MAMVEPPLPFASAPSRWYYVLLKGLVERGHRVTAFATCAKVQEIEQAAQLFPPDKYDLRCFAHPQRSGLAAKVESARRPYSYMFSPEMRAAVERELGQGFDVLHLEQLWCGWLGLDHADRSLVNVHHLVSIVVSLVPEPVGVQDRTQTIAGVPLRPVMLAAARGADQRDESRRVGNHGAGWNRHIGL